MWVVKCSGNGRYNGWYLAKPGSRCAYIPFSKHARKFSTRQQAQAECCGNEYPAEVKS